MAHHASHHRPLKRRDIHEAHRVATPLELLFDLTFVVAIAAAASQLHHAVAEQHLTQGLLGFAFAFVAIWWAWMNFTWFASAYDTDSVGYRLFTMIQMIGVLIVAAGVKKIEQGDFVTVVVGYVLMRVSLVAMWLRVARDHPEGRRTALRWGSGILVLQVLWVARLWLPASVQMPSYVVSSRSSSWCRSGPREPAASRGTRITSPSVTGSSRSSCSAKSCWARRTRWRA